MTAALQSASLLLVFLFLRAACSIGEVPRRCHRIVPLIALTTSWPYIMSSKQQKQLMDEALIEQPGPEDREGVWPSPLTAVGFGFLTFNSFMAVYRSNGDVGAIAFVIFSYLDLVLLFYCLRQYERTPPESPRREHIKMAVWLLTTLLTAAFSYKVAAIMPLPVQVLVWAMAGATVLGGFYAFFIHQEKTHLVPQRPN